MRSVPTHYITIRIPFDLYERVIGHIARHPTLSQKSVVVSALELFLDSAESIDPAQAAIVDVATSSSPEKGS